MKPLPWLARRQVMHATAAAGVLALANTGARGADAGRALRFTLGDNPPVLDPHGAPSGATRTHALAAFDTLFGMNSRYEVSPQMVDGVVVEDDGRRWTLVLRDGLQFHDGEPVLARDCVASIRRWMPRHTLGQALLSVTRDLAATDDRTIVFRLSRPFPLLPEALAATTETVAAIMPERLARIDGSPIVEIIGSGPYRFCADEHVADSRMVYERFAPYRPRASGAPDWTAGPKIAHLNRVEWTVMPDAATRAAALQTGELDWWGVIPSDLAPVLRRNRDIVIAPSDALGRMLTMRMNHLHPPFSNPEIRRALLRAVDQADFVVAVAGTDPSLVRTGVGLFPPGSPMANEAGLDVLRGPRDLAATRREITAAGYRGERVVLVSLSNDTAARACSEVGADMLRKAGFNVDFQSMDLLTGMQRVMNQKPIDQGGWSCFFPDWLGLAMLNPAANPYARGSGTSGRPGWPTSARLEELREAWLVAADTATQRRIAAEIQMQALADVTFIPLGLFYEHTAYRSDLTGAMQGFPPVFWNIRRRT